jgi:hypothetical protein
MNNDATEAWSGGDVFAAFAANTNGLLLVGINRHSSMSRGGYAEPTPSGPSRYPSHLRILSMTSLSSSQPFHFLSISPDLSSTDAEGQDNKSSRGKQCPSVPARAECRGRGLVPFVASSGLVPRSCGHKVLLCFRFLNQASSFCACYAMLDLLCAVCQVSTELLRIQ